VLPGPTRFKLRPLDPQDRATHLLGPRSVPRPGPDLWWWCRTAIYVVVTAVVSCASTTRSQNHSSPPTKRNSSTPAHGTTSPRSNSTHSCGSKVTTTAGDDTPHPKYLTPLEYELGYRKLTNWRPKPVSIKSGTLHGGIQADGEAPAPRQGTCLTPPYRTRPGPGLRRGRRPREGSPGPARPNPVGFSNPERGCPLTASGSSSSDAAQCR
jgi:hypothetical protein